MPDPIKYAACNPHPGFIRFPNGKLIRIFDAQGRKTAEYCHEVALTFKQSGGILPGGKKKK